MNIKIAAQLLPIMFGCVWLSGCGGSAPDSVEVAGAQIREVLPGKQNTVAFMSLTNSSPQPCSLTGGVADFADAIEVHQHIHSNGRMRMEKMDALPIPPGETVVMQPGDYHMMVMGVTTPLSAGKTVSMTLVFDDCPDQQIDLQVVSVLD